MERVTVQYNGEMVTLDVPEGMTDDEIIAFLQQQNQQQTQQKITQAPPNPVNYAQPAAVGTVAGAVRPLATGAATANARDAMNIAKNASAWTPNALTEVITHPLNTLRAYVQGHPMANTPIKQIAGSVGKNILGAAAQGVMAPENILMAPYMMAGYEQEKIRANPTAPEYEFNPYAMAQRGQTQTQGQAGARNIAQARQQMPTGPITPDQAKAILESGSARDIAAFGGQDKLNEMIRRKAAERVLGPVIP